VNSIADDPGRKSSPSRSLRLKVLPALIPASALIALAVSSHDQTSGTDYTIGGIVWGLSGIVLIALTILSIRYALAAGDDLSIFVFGWAGTVALATIGMLACWPYLEHDLSEAIFLTMLTSGLLVFGLVFVLWYRLPGNVGALAKGFGLCVGVPFLVYALFRTLEFIWGGYAT
jgi:hypothetical protein